MRKQFQQIWDLAVPYQDKRNDQGHAAVVMSYADFLTPQIPEADRMITIPTAILHDIGWSQLQKTSEAISRLDLAKEVSRVMHQVEGMNLAESILNQVGYLQPLTKRILGIILEHDVEITECNLIKAGYDAKTRAWVLGIKTVPGQRGFKNPNDGVVKDADKLWRYNHIGFWADVRRRGLETQAELLAQADLIEKDMKPERFMYSDIARKIALIELKARRQEIKSFYSK